MTDRSICQLGSSSSLVEKGLVDPPDTASAGLQHLEELWREHRPQPAQQLQLLEPSAGGSQRHLEPLDGGPGEVDHLHVLEAPQGAQQMAQAQASDLAVGYGKLQTNQGIQFKVPGASQTAKEKPKLSSSLLV